MKPISLLIPVPDVSAALAWYQSVFPGSERIGPESQAIAILKLQDLQIEIVKEDKKVMSGSSGVVLYWQVKHLLEEMERLEELGAKLYRGPISIENNESMCQLKDPFGNLIGLRGIIQ